MSDLKTSIIVDLKGNLEARARRYGSAMNGMSSKGNASLNRLNAGWTKHGKKLNDIAGRYTKIIGLAAAAAAGKAVIGFDAQLTRLQTNGRATVEQIAALKKEIIEVANDPSIRISKDDLLGGFMQIIEDTGDFEGAKNNLKTLGTFIQATGTAGKDAGAMVSLAFKSGIKDADKVLGLLDVLFQHSTRGSVGIPKLAAVGKGLFSPAAAATGASEQSMTDASAVAQITIDATKSADEAAEAIKSFLSMIQKDDTRKLLERNGVQVRKDDSLELRRLPELIPEIFNLAKGDFGKLGKLFGESGVKVFQGYSLPGNDEALQLLAQQKADGSLLNENARINAGTAQAALQSLKNKTFEGADFVFSEPTKNVADAADTFGKTDTLTNLKAINYSIGKTLLTVDGAIGKFLIDTNRNAGQAIIDGVRGLFSDEMKATVEIKVDGAASVTSVKSQSRNLDVDVDSGRQMVNE